MKLLVDTCNVLHRTGILPPDLAGVDERGLAALIAASRYGRNEVLLICDGTPGRGRRGRSTAPEGKVRLRFAGPRLTADELILQLVTESSTPRKLLVVSSDRAIGVLAKRRRCRIIDSDAFLSQLAHDATSGRKATSKDARRPDSPLGEEEVEEWMDHFELGGEKDEQEPQEP